MTTSVSDSNDLQQVDYAHHHIPAFLALPLHDDSGPVQIVHDGSQLTASNLQNPEAYFLSIQCPILVTDTPESIGMKLPMSSNEKNTSKNEKQQITVRDIATYVGNHMPVRVIDVQIQQELSGWIFEDLVEYFEDVERVRTQLQQQSRQSRNTRARRLVSTNLYYNKRPDVLNQISLEFSHTSLSDKVLSPQFVRDLDWINLAWPIDYKIKNMCYPAVQYYCLTSAAGCYTDFHIDFGGTSVWYHILSGSKEFCIIPPTTSNLQQYEKWMCSDKQHETFLPTLIAKDEVYRVVLQQNQTLFIPSGWIHSVYTPTDALVFGGNFLHGLDVDLQLQIHNIEVRSQVMEEYRFPYFIQLHFFVGAMYLNQSRNGCITKRTFESLEHLINALENWWNMYKSQQDDGVSHNVSVRKAAQEASVQAHCQSVDEFLLTLRHEHARVQKHSICPTTTPPPSIPATPSPRIQVSAPRCVPPAVVGIDTKSPRLMLHLSSGVVKPKSKSENAYLFNLSSAAQQGQPPPPPSPSDIPVARIQPREEISEYVDEQQERLKDEEWIPNKSSNSKPKIKQRSKKPTPVKKMAVSVVKKKKPELTSRQRLLGKFR